MKDEKHGKEVTQRQEFYPPVSFFSLYRFATPTDILYIIIATFCAILNGIAQPLLTLLFTFMIALFVDYTKNIYVDAEAARINLHNDVNKVCVQFVIAGAVTLVSAYGQMSLWMLSGERQALRIRHKYYESVLRQEMGWFDKNASGDLAGRISNDVNLVMDGLSDKLGALIQFFATFIAGFVLAFLRGWKLTLVLLSVVPLIILTMGFIEKFIAGNSSGGQAAYEKAGTVAEEVLGAIRTVYSFGAQERETIRYENQLIKARSTGRRRAIITGLGIGTIVCLLFMSYALGMWYGSKLIYDDEYTPQDVLAVFFCVLVGAMSIGQASPSLAAVATAKTAAAKLFYVINRSSQIDPFIINDDMINTQKTISPVKGRISFKNIHFSYPTRPDVPILRGVSLDIEPGTTVALVGPSGSGKSTSVGLIERFYDPISGSVELDGIDLTCLSIPFVREHIGLVGQEPVLFGTTIRQNILFGLQKDSEMEEDASILNQRIEQACKLANIHSFILTLPKGYETMVGEKGALLSGGQKQRIAIARALIKNPRILLLDEATSALDTESEKLVQQALDNASKNRTTIVIAHRLSTIRNADKIVVFKDGRIIEQGTHDQLVAQKNVYAELVKDQEVRTEQLESLHQNAPPAGFSAGALATFHPAIEDVVVEEEVFVQTPGLIRTLSRKNSVSYAQELKKKQLKKQRVPLWRVLKLTKPWLGLLIMGLIGSLVDGAVLPLYALILSKMTSAFVKLTEPMFREQGYEEANFWSLMFVLLACMAFCAINTRVSCLEYVGESLTFELRKTCFATLLKQEVGYFDDPINSVGILASKLSTEAEQVQWLISKVLGPLFMSASIATVGLTISFTTGWKLCLVIMGCVPLIAIANIMQISVLGIVNRRTKRAYELVSQVASESIMNIRTLAGLTREHCFYKDYECRVNLAHTSAKEGILRASFGYAVAMGAPFFIVALAFWYGTFLVTNGEYIFEEMFQVITAVLFTGMALGQASAQLNTLSKSKIAALDIFALLDRKPLIDDTGSNGEKSLKVQGNLEFKGGKFAYPSRPGVPILNGLDLSLMAGKHIALVGGSGSGKSTLIALAQRFYDLNQGQLFVEGTNIKSWNVPHLRSSMAVVGQEPVLFDMSVAENIAYSMPGASMEAIKYAAQLANAHTFISSLPDGYNTRVGERGGQLSGGQKQRIAIARALLRDPKLLLLDEATSALDSHSEKIVQEALDRASKGRTTITVAHRLSTIQDADIIVVMQKGKLVEMGSHDTLLAKQGVYYALVHQQQLNPIA